MSAASKGESKDLCIREKWYYVYIMTNRSKTLYIGVTGNVRRRVFEHKTGVFKGFTSRYKLDRLVYWERFKRVGYAIAREKQLNGVRASRLLRIMIDGSGQASLCAAHRRAEGISLCREAETPFFHCFSALKRRNPNG